MGKGWRYGIHAPTIEDTKTAIIKMGGVLDANVSVRECPECNMNKYYSGEVIQGKCIFVIFSTGESVFVRTELDNTLLIQTRPTRYHHNNQMNIPTGFFKSGKSTAYDILSTVVHYSFCIQWLGRMEINHMNRDRGDNRKVNLCQYGQPRTYSIVSDRW
jgi:hypothetical protein